MTDDIQNVTTGNGSSDYYEDYHNLFSPTIQKIAMYSNITIIPVGILLNILCLIVFIKSRIARSPTGLHLACLSVS